MPISIEFTCLDTIGKDRNSSFRRSCLGGYDMTEAAEERFPLIDADAHVIETEHTWDYLEPEDQKYRPKLFAASDDSAQEYWVINGRIGGFRFPTMTEKELAQMGAQKGRALDSAAEARQMDDVKLRLQGMDELGIDAQVLHNTMWIESLTEVPAIEGALCHAWNRWMADIFAQGEDRLYWTCVVPAFDLERAIEEMRYAHANGAVAVCLRPFEGEQNLIVTDKHFYPIFEEAERLNMAIAVHIANGSPELHRILKTGRDATFAGHMQGWSRFSIPTVISAMSVIMSHVHDDFPTLRWGMIEAAASWVPWLCYEYERRSLEPFGPESNPFLNNNIYVTATIDDDLAYIISKVGENVLLIGTDFGHTDTSAEYDALMKLRTTTDIAPSARTHMLSNNPAALYDLSERVKPVSTLAGVAG